MKKHLASVVFSAVASTICFAGAPANAADVGIARVYGPSVILGNMIRDGKSSPTVINVSAEEREMTFMYGYVLYNTVTCAEITPGAWTVNTEPQYGSDTFGSYNFKSSDSHCHDYTYKGAAIYYTSKDLASAHSKDATVGTWNTTYQGKTYTEYDDFKITITP